MTKDLPEGFAMRPATLADVDAITEVLNAEALATVARPTTSAGDLRTDLQMPSFDLASDSRVVAGPDGAIVAFMAVFDTAPHVTLFTWSSVHPRHWGKGIGTALAGWAEARGRASIEHAPHGARVVLMQEVLTSHAAAQELLRQRGYRPVRCFSRLRMELEAAPPKPVVPDGIEIRPSGGEPTLPAFVRAFQDAIRDHWGYVDQPFDQMLEEFQHWVRMGPRYDSSLWLVAAEGDEITGLAIAENETAEDPEMGYISELAVRRPWRRRGIGTALLLTCLGELYRRGRRRAALDVDAESLTGATRLYESVGMRLERENVTYEKELRPGRDLRTQKPPN